MRPILKYPFKAYLFAYGLRAGLPYGLLKQVNELHHAMARPRDYFARRKCAARILRDSPWRGYLSRRSGHRRFAPSEIPGLDRLVEIGQAIYRARVEDRPEDLQRPAKNPFAAILRPEDFAIHPELLEVPLSRSLVEIMSDYFGAVPRLDYIDLWITQPNLESNQGFSSQLYHLDKPEQTYVTVFLNVFEVWPENGPLTYLPGEITAGVRRATGYERLYYVGNGRLSDDVLHTLVDESELICLTGPAGAGGIVDTSACLHSGSRCTSGSRVVLAVSYTPAHRGRSHMNPELRRRAEVDPLRRLLLDSRRRAGATAS